jgi:hypothetical protein
MLKMVVSCNANHGMAFHITWHSILKGMELLKEGIIWRVGNGDAVNIWEDPWIPHGSTRRPRTTRESSLLTRVSDLINQITGLWDEALVLDTFWDFDVQAILKLRVNNNVEDLHGIMIKMTLSL